jgi:hypothetical protein
MVGFDVADRLIASAVSLWGEMPRS